MKVELKGSAQLKAALQEAPILMHSALAQEVEETAAEIEAGVKLRIQQGKKSGRIYRRGGVVHRASAPGEAPASDTGALIGSIYHEQEGALTWVAGARMDYAAHLEYGTRKMAARPAWRPEVEQQSPLFQARCETAIAKVLK